MEFPSSVSETGFADFVATAEESGASPTSTRGPSTRRTSTRSSAVPSVTGFVGPASGAAVVKPEKGVELVILGMGIALAWGCWL